MTESMQREGSEEELGHSSENELVCQDIKELPPVVQKFCEDCISRQYLLDNCVVDKVTMPYVPINKIENAPPVAPQPKTGHWIKTPQAVMGEGYMWYCDKCEHQVYQDSSRPYPSENYCPNCGAKMQEVEE